MLISKLKKKDYKQGKNSKIERKKNLVQMTNIPIREIMLK